MIQKVGVIYQDVNSLGFLEGLKERLGCEAKLVPPPTVIGTPSVMPRRTLKLAWEYFQKQRVDLIVRLTDADGKPWQEVRRTESARIPEGKGALWIFAAAVDCIEDWLALDLRHLGDSIGIYPSLLEPDRDRVGLIKKALTAARKDDDGPNIVRRIVANASTAIVKTWLMRDESLRSFYTDCRAAAQRAGCETDNDMEGEGA